MHNRWDKGSQDALDYTIDDDLQGSEWRNKDKNMGQRVNMMKLLKKKIRRI